MRRVAETLVIAGLWSRTSPGYAFVNWDELQPTRANVVAGREKNAEKLRKLRRPDQEQNQDETESVTGAGPKSSIYRSTIPT